MGPDGLTSGELPERRIEGYGDANTASVVASFRDHNDHKFSVGNHHRYTCELAGQLYLGINEQDLGSNIDGFQALITKTLDE